MFLLALKCATDRNTEIKRRKEKDIEETKVDKMNDDIYTIGFVLGLIRIIRHISFDVCNGTTQH